MTGEYGITLQNLIYTPTTSISGVEDKDTVCYMVWKQVFGNAYVMESERAEAYVAESMYRAGQITLREFVRGVALSGTYRRRFFECCGPYRAVELNFKHLLGRGPNSQKELSEHVQRIANEGFEAEINSYIDSEEYDHAFGDDFVPYMRFKGTYQTADEFNRMCTLASFPGTTDKSLTGRARQIGTENPNHVLSLDGAGIASKLVSVIAMNYHPSHVSVKKAIPTRPDIDIGRPMETVKVQENPEARTRYEIVPGSFMFLTKQEFADMKRETSMEQMITGYAQKEIADAKTQIAALEAKIKALGAAV
ncbi:Phycobilisome 27.9 kDa linker polypeptide, phycoerythrin-associated, rod [Gracilariopsis chorda]|uniref:Phycobilisome 27.9 kDa linker polypeptide, phycoerythrin-associated, rod n=1 Tax=Gracilariopsis chorda TaxID=448386 RepID=A0A2V3J2S1_9FLOR|nr:Phycobilisome 27.9 kDa linker polypeptide, phycoerythrin-associated, rod [Gracilariopsis chorda]|eukprot:PXF48746.1 Phycobilisome 27.9 kDa linker polypeptide, phycoerythrin-associated, rod [Gracilariopsis chorda]